MFGLRNSGYAGQRTTSAVVYIFKKTCKDKAGNPFDALNYSDDFGGVGRSVDAWVAYYALGALLERIGLEESLDKASPPSTSMAYLGVQFDSEKMEKTVTPERILELKEALERFILKEVATKSELQSIAHKLLWVSTCVVNSRIFVSRIISDIKKLEKNHHKIKFSPEVKMDLSWWKHFISKFSGVSLITENVWSRPDAINAGDNFIL
jgi:hypothetical protein